MIRKLLLISLISLPVYAGDNHVHVEQVNGGDNLSLTATQQGYDNMIQFSTNHANNTFDFLQIGEYFFVLEGRQSHTYFLHFYLTLIVQSLQPYQTFALMRL